MAVRATPEAPDTDQDTEAPDPDQDATEPVAAVDSGEATPAEPVAIDYAAAVQVAKSALDATIAEARTANTGDMDAFLAVASKVQSAKATLDKAIKAASSHAREVQAAQFAAMAGERNRVKAEVEGLEIPPFIALGLGLGLTIRYETVDGVQVCRVILPDAPRTSTSRSGGTGKGAPTGQRIPIIYAGAPDGTGKGTSLQPRTFMERVAADYAGTEHGSTATNALAAVAKAKAEGKFSPGYDAAKRKLLAAGLGTQG